MAKKVDPIKAKAAKQKKMAIGLSAVFVAVLAFQGPKTLKMLSGPTATVSAPAAALVPATSTTATGTVPAGTPGVVATAAGAAGEAQPAVLADSDLPIEPGEGQLLSFEQFEAKDPFDQQVDPDLVVADQPSSDGDGTADEADATTDKEAEPLGDTPDGTVVPGTDTGTSTTQGGSTPTAPAEPVAPATATTISLNGILAELAADGTFPADDPVFLLVSTAKDGRSVEIGIAGGVYADGDATITLKVGKPVTLQNTADGSRYELELLTVQGFVPPASKK